MRTLWILLILVSVGATTAFAQAPAPAATPPSSVITNLEALQKRNAAAPDEAIYEYDVESRVNADPKIAALRDQVSVLEVKLAKAQDKFAEGSPQLRKAQDELESVKKHLAEVQRGLREQIVTSTLARARENSALAGKTGIQAYAVDDLVAADSRVAAIQAQIAPIEAKYQQLKATYVDGAPQLKPVKQKLDELNDKLNQIKATVRKEVEANPRAAQGAGGGVGAVDAGAGLTAVPTAAQPALSREEQALNMPLTLDLHAEHLQAIADQMGQSLGISFVLDNRVVAPKGAAGAKAPEGDAKAGADKAKTEAYATDGMVAAVTVGGKPLREALRAILGPMGLDYTVQPGFIWISTPKHLRHESFEILETRQYAIEPKTNIAALNANADLPTPVAGAFDVMDVLRKAIPEVVAREDGAILSKMIYDEGAHQLTAHTTPSNHKKIQAILESMNVGGLAKLPTN
jgi:hypothetical protein